jgi:hypothetical protein
MIKVSEDCEDQEPWFEAEVIIREGQPAGFKEWCKGIKQCKYTILIPDGTTVFAKLFIDFNQRFDNESFTIYILNRYGEL